QLEPPVAPDALLRAPATDERHAAVAPHAQPHVDLRLLVPALPLAHQPVGRDRRHVGPGAAVAMGAALVAVGVAGAEAALAGRVVRVRPALVRGRAALLAVAPAARVAVVVGAVEVAVVGILAAIVVDGRRRALARLAADRAVDGPAAGRAAAGER